MSDQPKVITVSQIVPSNKPASNGVIPLLSVRTLTVTITKKKPAKRK